jgi:Protein of unknown function (DUF3151)
MTSQELPTPGASSKLPSPDVLGVPQTRLPDDAAAREALDAGMPAEQVASEYPAASLAWAVLAEQGLASGRAVEAYAYARTGYHRGLDALRRAGWRGQGPVPWEHVPNRGFLRALAALAHAAGAIGETPEQERCTTFLADCDPVAARELGLADQSPPGKGAPGSPSPEA